MKHFTQFLLATLLALLSTSHVAAYDFKAPNADGVTIYYYITSSEDLTCAVTYRRGYSDPYSNEYSGSVTIPSTVEYNGKTYSVTAIDDYAFYGCYSLTSVEIPNSVTSIGYGAFRECDSLTSVEIPNSVTSIGYKTFFACSSLTSVEIPSSVTSIGEEAFYDCDSLTSVEIPNSVTSIGDYAFARCSSLTSVEIPNSVTSIGGSAFAGCYSLASVEIPSSVTTIKSKAFSGCWCLASVAFNATNCTQMGSFDYPVFKDCSHLSTLTIGNEVTKIPAYAFKDCSNLTSVEIPNSVTSIGDYAFYGSPALKSATIGTGVTFVGDYAFDGCTSLHKLALLPNTVPTGLYGALPSSPLEGRITYVANDNYSNSNLGTIKRYDYLSSYFEVDGIRYVPVSPSERTCAAIDCTYDKDVKNIVIGETVTYRGVQMKVVEINPYLLIGNNSVQRIEVSAPADIQDYFAYKCPYVKEVKCNNDGNIGAFSFRYCTNLKTATLSNTGSIGGSCFSGCTNLQTASLAETVTGIGSQAFYNCSLLQDINIPSAVKTIEEKTFYGCSSLTNIVLPEALTTIDESAFAYSGLTSITIPAATTSIANGAFNGCKSLARFEAKDGKEGLKLGYNGSNKGLFYDCPLKEVVIGRNLLYDTSSKYGYSPFYRNTALEKVTMTDIPTEVFTNEFYGCTSLKHVSIGDGVTQIGDYAFSGCSALDYFAFGAKVKSIGNEAFSDCTNLTKLYAEPATPPTCGTQALDDINKWNCTLYVPEEAMDGYKQADQWKEFFFIEAGTFSDAITAPLASQGTQSGKTYNLQGIEVGDSYRGMVIRNGKKIVKR